MSPSPSDRTPDAWDRLTSGSLIDGYAALGLVLALVAIPYLPSAFKPFEIMAGLPALLLSVVFIDRGLSLGRGSGRNAARLALVILATLTVATMVVGVMVLFGYDSGGRPHRP